MRATRFTDDGCIEHAGLYPKLADASIASEAQMAQSQLATRIDARVKKAVEAVCAARGLKINRFIEDALLDKLEEIEDIEDLKGIRHDPTRPFQEVVKDLKRLGKL